jgi:hypothetical protein
VLQGVSFSAMADLQSALGVGEAVRQSIEKSLEIAERLVAQEPWRADYLLDPVKSLARIGSAHCLHVLAISCLTYTEAGA